MSIKNIEKYEHTICSRRLEEFISKQVKIDQLLYNREGCKSQRMSNKTREQSGLVTTQTISSSLVYVHITRIHFTFCSSYLSEFFFVVFLVHRGQQQKAGEKKANDNDEKGSRNILNTLTQQSYKCDRYVVEHCKSSSFECEQLWKRLKLPISNRTKCKMSSS